jgi:hypothetical protein
MHTRRWNQNSIEMRMTKKKKNINCKQQSREPKKIRSIIENKIAGTDELKLYKRRKHK